ncbi:MAG: SDR family NAD(P)-dependent oxidoreductase [Deltaproteobacteria bacterium]|nr:SDR family NAD(P)-dependent oxidoreductase [Deltaproteobacteria bacterium]
MAAMLDLEGRRVLITGASSGLGLEMARLLAKNQRAHPILVARRKEKLEELRQELAGLGAKAEVISADLTRPDDVARVYDESVAGGEVHSVILNAGITHFGRFRNQDEDSIHALFRTNVEAVVRLTHKFVTHILGHRQNGGIMIVSSMAGMQPMPFQAIYGGTKAFLNSFAAAVAEELRDEPISISVYCPGGIDTNMVSSSAMSTKYKKGHPMIMDPVECAQIGLDAFRRRKSLTIPGTVNNLAALGSKLGPRGLVARLVANDYAEALPESDRSKKR